MEDGTERVGDVEPDAVKGGGVEEAGSVGEGGGDSSGCCTDWVWDLYGRQGGGRVGGAPVGTGTRRGSVWERDAGGARGVSVRGVTRRWGP